MLANHNSIFQTIEVILSFQIDRCSRTARSLDRSLDPVVTFLDGLKPILEFCRPDTLHCRQFQMVSGGKKILASLTDWLGDKGEPEATIL